MRDSTWGLSRTVAAVFGVVYVLVGVLGFIPGMVTGSAPAGMESASGNLLGIFPINAVHNIVHLLIGAALLYGATSRDAAVGVLRIVGVAYLIVGVLGIISPNGFGLLPLGGADIGLHLGTGAILLLVSFLDRRDRDTDRREARTV
jgi:hypothetical protein